MGTRPGLRSIPHISGILLLMQLLLLQPLVDAKAETSAAVDPRSVPASPAKMTDFKQEGDANGFRVFITFEGNPHYRGIEELVKVSTNGWNETFSEPRDNTTKFKRTFEFVIPEEFKFHQFAIIFGKEVHIFQLEATGFEKNAVYQKYIGLVNYLSEKVKYMMPDYGVGWMSQVVRKELDNIIYTQTNLSDDLRQLKTDVESIEAKLPESFDDFVTIEAFQASETKISGLKSEMTQTEEASETKISGLESEITQMKASETKINKLESKIAQMEKGIRCQSGRVRFGNMGKDNGQGNWMKKEISLTGFKSQPTSFSYALSEFFADFTEERKGSGVVLTGWTHNSTLAFIWARGYKGKPVYHMHATWMACSH